MNHMTEEGKEQLRELALQVYMGYRDEEKKLPGS